MNLSTVKSVAPNKNLFKKIAALIFSIVVISGSFVVISNANREATDTVEVLRVKPVGGIAAFVVLTQEHVEKYRVIKKEYKEDMILAKDMPSVLNKLTKYYLREDSILYKDQLMDEKPLKHEWLYKLDEEKEVLTLPYNYLECGGDILVPGDRVRIRVSYEAEKDAVVEDNNPNAVYTQNKDKTIKTEVLFDSIVIKDMLNSNSRSIYEVYKEVTKLSEDKKQEVMKSESFLKNIQPKALLLEGTREQINNYAKYKGFEGKSFLITILSRANSQTVIDQLPTLEKEVESWIENKKKE